MKSLYASLVAILACSVLFLLPRKGKKKPSKTEKREMLATRKDSIDHKTFTINVNMKHPMSHAAINLTNNYSLRLAGDSLILTCSITAEPSVCPYGGGKALNFSAKIKVALFHIRRRIVPYPYLTVSSDEDTLSI